MNIGNGLIEQMDIIYQKKLDKVIIVLTKVYLLVILQELPYSVSIYLTIVF